MLMSSSQHCTIALSISNTSLQNDSLQSHEGEQGIICDKLPLTSTNSDVNFANGLSSHDGYEMWEVSNTILVKGEHKDTLFICVQNS